MCHGDEISQFFHILSSVVMPCGSVRIHGKPEITQYSCCCDTENGVYFYKTYDNSRITGIQLRNCPLDSSEILRFDLRHKLDILYEN